MQKHDLLIVAALLVLFFLPAILWKAPEKPVTGLAASADVCNVDDQTGSGTGEGSDYYDVDDNMLSFLQQEVNTAQQNYDANPNNVNYNNLQQALYHLKVFVNLIDQKKGHAETSAKSKAIEQCEEKRDAMEKAFSKEGKRICELFNTQNVQCRANGLGDPVCSEDCGDAEITGTTTSSVAKGKTRYTVTASDPFSCTWQYDCDKIGRYAPQDVAEAPVYASFPDAYGE